MGHCAQMSSPCKNVPTVRSRMSSSPHSVSQNVSTLQGRPHGAGNVSAGCRCLLNKPISPNSRVFPPSHCADVPINPHPRDGEGGGVLTLQSRPRITEASWRCSSVPKLSSPPKPLSPEEGTGRTEASCPRSDWTSHFQNTLPLSPVLTLHPPEGAIQGK